MDKHVTHCSATRIISAGANEGQNSRHTFNMKKENAWVEEKKRHTHTRYTNTFMQGHIWWAILPVSSSLHFSLCLYTHLADPLHLLRCDIPALCLHLLLLLTPPVPTPTAPSRPPALHLTLLSPPLPSAYLPACLPACL